MSVSPVPEARVVRVFPDCSLDSPHPFLISRFTIARKLRREGLTPSFVALEVYACGCILNTDRVEDRQTYEPCGIHELPYA